MLAFSQCRFGRLHGPSSIEVSPTSRHLRRCVMADRPLLSVIVVFFNMRREAPRTLHSLGRAYQRRTDDIDYEVIAVDNGSSEPLTKEFVNGLDAEFRYFYLDTDSVSPAGAIQLGASQARGRFIAVCVDGARMCSPGIIHYTALATRLSQSPIVATLAWHLGEKLQNESMLEGYTQTVEDELLASVEWRDDGYRLFEISCFAGSSANGWFLPFDESNFLTVSRPMFDTLGGFDVGFQSPGGGLANHDYFKRACELPGSELIVLLGEGTFHMFHGGTATNVPMNEHPWERFAAEYQQLRRGPYQAPRKPALYLGSFPSETFPFLEHSMDAAFDSLRRSMLTENIIKTLQPKGPNEMQTNL